MDHRVIFHIDVNSAFLSWEAVYRLKQSPDAQDLRNIPAVIGGDESRRHGIVLAASLPAKKYGIRTAETIREALTKCPELTLCRPRYSMYQEYSRAFIEEALKFSPVLEQYSIDEVFLDMTETIHSYGSPYEAAVLLKDRIRDRLGFTVNIGVAPNKLLAKMASDFEKPDKVHTLFPEEIPEKMWPLPVKDLFLVGKATQKKLSLLGIRTIGELAQMDLKMLKAHVGNKHGQTLYHYARGIDLSPVDSEESLNKGYGNSITLAKDIDSLEEADHVLISLSEMVASRLRKNHVRCSCICVEIKGTDFRRSTHQRKLRTPTDITDEISRTARELYRENYADRPVRLIGVRATDITREEFAQLDLFEQEKKEKLRKLDASIDKIRKKFGKDSIQRASFLKGDIDHMTGGHRE
ncbi:MAG TPA: DNA polymerase IV [Candidatus Anaerostipes avicola]|uniref:DNA polymerase Y family protein n=1 Tax=Anaerostipes butyraticus TaxID=645466 RepID=UPI001F8D8267|nr:DNA polymerase IV [Anaerostipes butyraticus]HJC83599.1 DNA polymerase IV [Candidatus Anaerostipes avicola]